ncbi:MAG TPA: hypothetical protein VMT88_03290 [Actinomycetes bacterium]|nr:hypothetical protein [Actinomycetes bacterium]
MRRSRSLAVVAVAGLLSVTASAASAGSWSLDPSFSGNGVLRLPQLAGSSGNMETISVTNGLVYASGTTYTSSGSGIFVVRTLADGTLDSSFGDNGIARTSARNQGHLPVDYDHAVLNDGSSVSAFFSAFSARGSHKKLTVVRWTNDGVLDTSFSGDGVRTLRLKLSNTPYGQLGVAVDRTGRIVVGVMGAGDDRADDWIYRLEPSGALDDRFAGDGLRRIDLFKYDWIDDLTVDSRNRVLIAADHYGDPDPDKSHVFRLDNRGSIDAGFGVVQFKIHSPSVDYVAPTAIGVDANNVITIALQGKNAYGSVRIRPNGNLDNDYGLRGVVGLSCTCVLSRAQVVNGRVAVVGYPGGYAGPVLVTSISQSGNRVVQGLVQTFPTGLPLYEAVAVDGNAVIYGGIIRSSGFLAKVQ